MDMHDDPEADKRTQSLADLPSTTEQAKESKAGELAGGGFTWTTSTFSKSERLSLLGSN